MRSKAVLLWLLLSAVSFADAPLRFSWAVVFRRGEQQVLAMDYSSRIVRLSSGDRLRIHFQPRSRCCLYVYLLDSRQDLYLLHRQSYRFQADQGIERGYTLPQGGNWYYLDDRSGVELFYLIVSIRRLRRLEKLSSRPLPQEAENGHRPRLAREQPVLDEIQRLIQQNSSLAGPRQSPTTLAGNLRGITEDSDIQGIEVEAQSVYVRTIRLEH